MGGILLAPFTLGASMAMTGAGIADIVIGETVRSAAGCHFAWDIFKCIF